MADGQQPNLIAAALWGGEYAIVEQVIERELGVDGDPRDRSIANEPIVRLLALAAYRQGVADEHERNEPPF